MPACARSRMFYYVYTDHAQYTIKTYAKMALFPLLLTGPLSLHSEPSDSPFNSSEAGLIYSVNVVNF